jgi:DNA polymerase-3 subunit delta
MEAAVHALGDPTFAEMNTTRLDGRQNGEEEVRSAAFAMPFLTARRLVIVTNPFARCTTDAARKRFLALLDSLPETTQLVLLVDDSIERGKQWKTLPAVESNWMRKWLRAAGDRAVYELCALPTVREMANWVRTEAVRQGGKFSPDACMMLVSLVGNDTRTATQEIEKLLNYVDFKRPVDVTDVEEMTAQTGQADIFAMVDAMAGGNARQALELLHRLLETQEPLHLFGMITRQFRLVLQARELLDEGRAGQAAGELHVHPFVAEKAVGQARRFSMKQLEEIYHQLLDIDQAIKTSQMPGDLALDTFVASLSRSS